MAGASCGTSSAGCDGRCANAGPAANRTMRAAVCFLMAAELYRHWSGRLKLRKRQGSTGPTSTAPVARLLQRRNWALETGYPKARLTTLNHGACKIATTG